MCRYQGVQLDQIRCQKFDVQKEFFYNTSNFSMSCVYWRHGKFQTTQLYDFRCIIFGVEFGSIYNTSNFLALCHSMYCRSNIRRFALSVIDAYDQMVGQHWEPVDLKLFGASSLKKKYA